MAVPEVDVQAGVPAGGDPAGGVDAVATSGEDSELVVDVGAAGVVVDDLSGASQE